MRRGPLMHSRLRPEKRSSPFESRAEMSGKSFSGKAGAGKRKTTLRRGRATTNFLVENLGAATLSCGVGRTRAPAEDAAPTSKMRRRPRRLRRRQEHPHRRRARALDVFSAEKCVRSRKDARRPAPRACGAPLPARAFPKTHDGPFGPRPQKNY